jgi:dUTP pyrophosphatase
MNENFTYYGDIGDYIVDIPKTAQSIIDSYYILKFAKVNDKAIIPTKRNEDAGYDIYTTDKDIVLQPHQTVAFHTGLVSEFSPAWVGIIKERGSTAKYGLSIRSGVIDSGYRGEWLIMISNVSDKYVIFSDDKDISHHLGPVMEDKEVLFYPLSKAIAQVIFLPVPKLEVKEVELEDLSNSERGEGKFGSSGK